jgi:drug/metabolite transporter (DMT)-like permease
MNFFSHSYYPRIGIFYMLFAIFIFSTVNAMVKDVINSYPLMQIIFLRFSCALLPCAFTIYQSGGWKTLKTSNLKAHFFCGCVAVLNLSLLFSSFKFLPLADVTAFAFSTILFITLMSYPILKEKVEFHRWLAVIGGFLGVLIMLNPSGDLFNIGSLMAVIFAFGDGLLMVFARLLSRTDKSSTIVFYCSFIACAISALFVPFVWIKPSLVDMLKLIFLGAGSGTAQILLTYAYRYAQAALVAPVIYTAILWSTFYGYYFWGEVPSLETLTGGSLVVLSGFYLIYKETISQSPPVLKRA